MLPRRALRLSINYDPWRTAMKIQFINHATPFWECLNMKGNGTQGISNNFHRGTTFVVSGGGEKNKLRRYAAIIRTNGTNNIAAANSLHLTPPLPSELLGSNSIWQLKYGNRFGFDLDRQGGNCYRFSQHLSAPELLLVQFILIFDS